MAGHDPAPPATPEPPQQLADLVRSLRHPGVAATGLTTTNDGEWALYVRTRRGVEHPMADVEAAAAGFPVIYETEQDHRPVARPAYPDLGE